MTQIETRPKPKLEDKAQEKLNLESVLKWEDSIFDPDEQKDDNDN